MDENYENYSKLFSEDDLIYHAKLSYFLFMLICIIKQTLLIRTEISTLDELDLEKCDATIRCVKFK